VSDRPMGVCEAEMAVEALLGRPASRDSVNSCLSTGARGVRPSFGRVAPGRYRLIRGPEGPIGSRVGATARLREQASADCRRDARNSSEAVVRWIDPETALIRA